MTNNTEILRTEGLKRSYLVNETKIDATKISMMQIRPLKLKDIVTVP